MGKIGLETPRRRAILSNDFKPVCPSGKSLLIFGNRVKPQNQKYFAFPEGQISGIGSANPAHTRGRFAIVTMRWAGLRWTLLCSRRLDEGVRRSRVVLAP
jgi:hypothetical protein